MVDRLRLQRLGALAASDIPEADLCVVRAAQQVALQERTPRQSVALHQSQAPIHNSTGCSECLGFIMREVRGSESQGRGVRGVVGGGGCNGIGA